MYFVHFENLVIVEMRKLAEEITVTGTTTTTKNMVKNRACRCLCRWCRNCISVDFSQAGCWIQNLFLPLFVSFFSVSISLSSSSFPFIKTFVDCVIKSRSDNNAFIFSERYSENEWNKQTTFNPLTHIKFSHCTWPQHKFLFANLCVVDAPFVRPL